MSQEFHGGVGQVAAGNISNYDVNIGVHEKAESRGLVSAQRKELHELRSKCEELGDDPRDVWRSVHAQLGVTSISEISTEQFAAARAVLEARLAFLLEDADKRRLVGKVLRATTEKDAKSELNNFCELSFGRIHLNSLSRVDLQRVLEFIQGFQVKPLQVEHAVTPSDSIPAPRLPIRDFLITYRVNAFWLFMFGIIVDRFWFR